MIVTVDDFLKVQLHW